MALATSVTPTGAFDSDAIAAALNEIRAVAPGDLRDDIATMSEGISTFYSILNEAGVDFSNPGVFNSPEAQAALQSATDALESSGFAEASDNVNTWLEGSCGS